VRALGPASACSKAGSADAGPTDMSAGIGKLVARAMWAQTRRKQPSGPDAREKSCRWRQNAAHISVSLSESGDSRDQPRTVNNLYHFGRRAARDGKGAPALHACDPDALAAPPARGSTADHRSTVGQARYSIRALQGRGQPRRLLQAERHRRTTRRARLRPAMRPGQGASEPGTLRQRTRLSSGAVRCDKLRTICIACQTNLRRNALPQPSNAQQAAG
jgi:hypothetical protein